MKVIRGAYGSKFGVPYFPIVNSMIPSFKLSATGVPDLPERPFPENIVVWYNLGHARLSFLGPFAAHLGLARQQLWGPGHLHVVSYPPTDP